MKDILSYSGLAQARLIRRGEISSAELVEAHLERIVEVNPLLNAVVEVLAEQAREGARAADERRARGTLLGPLDGVPFSIKDSIEVVGTSCSAGTLGLRNAPRSKRDATLVARLRAAGAIPIARTNLPDLLFAFESDNLIYGRTNNPYDPSIGTRFGEDRSPTVAARNEGAITESGSAITGSGGANVGGKGVITWSGGTIVGTESAITGCGGAIVASAGAIPGSEGLIAGSKSAIAGSESAVVGEEHFDHGVFSSGGSSGGEAALIAACGSPFGLGSDAAGSVRLPSHFCGIASIKPTSGRLARTGHVPGAGGWIETLWQIGPMARRVEDLCAMMAILNGPDGLDHTVVPVPLGDPLRVDVGGLRIAWFADNGIATPTQETAELVRCAAKALGATESRPPRIEESYDL